MLQTIQIPASIPLKATAIKNASTDLSEAASSLRTLETASSLPGAGELVALAGKFADVLDEYAALLRRDGKDIQNKVDLFNQQDHLLGRH